LAGCALLTWLSATTSPRLRCQTCQTPRAALAVATSIDRSTSPAEESTDEEDGKVDLYGNEVTSAVATYKLDATGSLYELHSPNTALPRLGSPKS